MKVKSKVKAGQHNDPCHNDPCGVGIGLIG
jgi:hypothetical protein